MKYLLATGLAIVLFFVAVVMYYSGMMYPLEIIDALFLGWLRFLIRVLPDVNLTVSGTLATLVCLALIAVGLHRLCIWVYRYNQQVKAMLTETTLQKWHWRWTLAVLGVLMLMFVAGLSAVGVTHQVSWLATSPEPLLIPGESTINRMEATNNLKLIGICVHSYEGVHQKLPPGGTFDDKGNGLHSWMTLIMPYGLASTKNIDFKLPWDHPKNAPIFKTGIYPYYYPGSPITHDAEGYGVSHYATNVHVIGGNKSISFKDITDGLENTLLIGQVAENHKPWGQPINWRDPALGLNKSPNGFGNVPKTGVLFLMADGHVKFLTNETSPQVLKALSTPNAGD